MVLFLSAGKNELMSAEELKEKIEASKKIISSPAYVACKMQAEAFSKQIELCEPSQAPALAQNIASYFSNFQKAEPTLYSESFSLAHRELISKLMKKQTGEDMILG